MNEKLEHIIIEPDKESRVITVTLDNQPLNICNRFFYNEITSAFREINLMSGYGAVLLKSNCRHFCAGGELEEIQFMSNPKYVDIIAGGATEAFDAIYFSRYPVVSAVNGKAIGAGNCIAAVSDVVVAEEGASFCMPEMTCGSICAAEYLQMMVPKKVARYYAYTGKHIPAREMMKYGGVFDVVPKEKLVERAMEICKEIACQSPIAIELMKEKMNENDNERLAEKFMNASKFTPIYNASEDCKETYRAFKERRKPVYKGK